MVLRPNLGVLALALGFGAATAPLAAPSARPHVGAPSPAAARPAWEDPARRDAAGEVPQIVARMGLRRGMTVGDLGAGTGYDTLRLARVVGPNGRMIAEDVDPAALDVLKTQAQQRGLANVVIALGEPQDPRLPPRVLDAAILIHMYSEITHPYAFLYNLSSALKPGASVGVEALDRSIARHGAPPALLRCEFEAVGFHLKSLSPMKGGLGYFAVFAAPDRPPAPQRIHACGS